MEWLLTLRGIDLDIANKMFTNIQLLVFSLFGLRDLDNGEGEQSVLSMTGAGFWMGLVGDSSNITQRAATPSRSSLGHKMVNSESVI
jgi:hypothetical protein